MPYWSEIDPDERERRRLERERQEADWDREHEAERAARSERDACATRQTLMQTRHEFGELRERCERLFAALARSLPTSRASAIADGEEDE